MLKAFKISGIRQFKEFTEIIINCRDEVLNSYLRPYDDSFHSDSVPKRKRGTYKKIRELHSLCTRIAGGLYLAHLVCSARAYMSYIQKALQAFNLKCSRSFGTNMTN